MIHDLDNVDFIPSNVNSSHSEALLSVFEDNEAVIKMIIKGRNPTMRHVSRTHSVVIGFLIESIWTTKVQIKHIDTRNQLADILTKGNFTRDEWNHLLCLFNISHFSSTNCSEVMSKRTQKDLGEERVTGKSKPMINLVSRCSERTPDVLPSTASESPGKTRNESQFPLSPQTVQHKRTVRPVENAYSSSYSEWNVDKNWSSQEWKSDKLMEDRTGRLVVTAQYTDRILVDDDKMNSYTEAESEMSLESRSFLHRVNDQVRKGQNQPSKDAIHDSNKHSVIWCNKLMHQLRKKELCSRTHKWPDNLRTSLAAPKEQPKRSPSHKSLMAFGQSFDKKRHKQADKEAEYNATFLLE